MSYSGAGLWKNGVCPNMWNACEILKPKTKKKPKKKKDRPMRSKDVLKLTTKAAAKQSAWSKE